MRATFQFALIAAALVLLAGCAGTGASGAPSEYENRRQLCQQWVGNPDDPTCHNTFRRDRV